MALSKNEKMEKENLEVRKDLKAYRTREKAPEHLNIGLFGRSGCGKTSLINSMKYAVEGSFRRGKWYSVGNIQKAGGYTLKRLCASLEDNISVIDNRGVDDLTKDGILDELKAQIDGKRGYSVDVIWGKPKGAADKVVISEGEQRKYSIGCVVFVFSARDDLKQSINGLFKAVHHVQKHKGRYPVAVITNVDCGDRERVEKLKTTLEVTGISEIFEVANITNAKEDLELSYQHSLLSLLDRCMTDGDANDIFKRHQQKEEMEKDKQEKMEREEEQKKQEREEKQRREKERKRGEEQKEQEIEEKRKQDIQKQKLIDAEARRVAAAKAALLSSTTGAGALIGSFAGPVGAGVGAVAGAAVGGVLNLIP